GRMGKEVRKANIVLPRPEGVVAILKSFNKKAGSKFWQYRDVFLKYRWTLLGGVLALVFTNLLAVAIPWLVKLSVESLQRNNQETLHQYLLWILVISVLMLGIRIASRVFLLGLGRKLEYDFRNLIYKHLLGLPPSFYMANPTGELMSRLTND